MKKLLTIIALQLFFIIQLNAQLSPQAQAIYDSCLVHTPGNVSYALANGVQVTSTPDSSSFYLLMRYS